MPPRTDASRAPASATARPRPTQARGRGRATSTPRKRAAEPRARAAAPPRPPSPSSSDSDDAEQQLLPLAAARDAARALVERQCNVIARVAAALDATAPTTDDTTPLDWHAWAEAALTRIAEEDAEADADAAETADLRRAMAESLAALEAARASGGEAATTAAAAPDTSASVLWRELPVDVAAAVLTDTPPSVAALLALEASALRWYGGCRGTHVCVTTVGRSLATAAAAGGVPSLAAAATAAEAELTSHLFAMPSVGGAVPAAFAALTPAADAADDGGGDVLVVDDDDDGESRRAVVTVV